MTNEKGYEPVVFDQSKCIACAMCYTVCPDYAIQVNRESKGAKNE